MSVEVIFVETKRYYRIEQRPVAVFLALCIAIGAVALRLAYLQTGGAEAVSAASDEKSVSVHTSRGCIYDRNLVPLVNAEHRNVTARILTGETRAGVSEDAAAAHGGVCITEETERPLRESLFCKNIPTVRRYADRQLCTHVIGYVDSAGRGVCGVEHSFDRVLQEAGGTVYVKYTANGRGQAIPGCGLRVVSENYDSSAGVVLTVDAIAQHIVEDALAASSVRRGAAVVLETDTGAVLAMASVPAYDVDNLSASLKDESLPFLNRAISCYPVGSVFKPFIAAAAMEHGTACPEDYICGGQTETGGLCFRCYRSTAHGALDLQTALARSCNCYFIALGQAAGAHAVAETCAAFGFGQAIALTSDLTAAAGVLPDAVDLKSPAALANLCFGQGELLATPLHLAAAYAALANGGIYRAPYITKALVDENKTEYAVYKNETARRAAGRAVCEAINEGLRLNMTEGTGKNGASDLFAAAGKTATAQTGRYGADGKEQLCTWFCGFFPYEAPKYTVVVFNEDGAAASEDCAPVFKAISEGVWLALGP